MSFSKYTIEKKQVSIDNGMLSIICTHPDITSIGSTAYGTYLPSGIAKSVTFVSGMTCCVDTWGSSDNIIIDECHNSSMTAKTATITTGWNPIRAYNSYVLNGREMISGSFCGKATCYNITEFMPWIDPNDTITIAYKMRYVKEQSSDDWKIDEEWTPELITFCERWVKTNEDIYHATWQHQIATDILPDDSELGWHVVWKDEGEPFDYEYEVSIPQDVEIIEYLRADGVAASSSGWTDGYQMKVKIDPTNLGTPSGYLADKCGCIGYEPKCSWTMTSYYVKSTCGDLVELTPNEWKIINIDVVDGDGLDIFASFFCKLKFDDRCAPTVMDGKGYTLKNTYVGGLIRNNGHMYFPYKIPSNLGWEDEYLNASEYGFIDREGDKIPLEYVYAKYTNTNVVTQSLKGNASTTLNVPSDAVDIVFSNHVTSLPSSVCIGNTVLTSVTMNNVTSIGAYAFNGCTSLTEVNMSSSVTSIGDYSFVSCKSLKSIDIPSSVTKIGDYAFARCTSLTSVDIPSSVTEIGGCAFDECSNLEIVNMNSIHPPIVGPGVFTEALITIPQEADLEEWKRDENWYRYKNMIVKRGLGSFIYRDSSHEGKIDDLGVTLKDNTKIEIKLRPIDYSGPKLGMIIGEVNLPINDNDDYRLFWHSNGPLCYDYGCDRISSPLPIYTDYVFEVGNYYIKDLTSGNYILQGDAKSGVATAHTRTLGLFGDVNNDYAWIYYIKIYEGDTLVKDFIPVKLEDGSGTLYDTLSKTYCSVSNGTLGIYGV